MILLTRRENRNNVPVAQTIGFLLLPVLLIQADGALDRRGNGL